MDKLIWDYTALKYQLVPIFVTRLLLFEIREFIRVVWAVFQYPILDNEIFQTIPELWSMRYKSDISIWKIALALSISKTRYNST